MGEESGQGHLSDPATFLLWGNLASVTEAGSVGLEGTPTHPNPAATAGLPNPTVRSPKQPTGPSKSVGRQTGGCQGFGGDLLGQPAGVSEQGSMLVSLRLHMATSPGLHSSSGQP